MLKILFVIIITLSCNWSYCQRIINLKLDFDTKKYGSEESYIQYYTINPYLPRQKGPLSIHSNSLDTPHYKYYAPEVTCPDSGNAYNQHGFYCSINLYHNGVPSARDLLVAKLEACLQVNKKYEFSIDARYHRCCNYQIDSLQVLFVKSEEDIKLFMAEKPFNGSYLKFSVNDVDSRVWYKINSDFESLGNYNYMVLGNLKTDEETSIKKAKHYCCSKNKKDFWDYSEILLDNIIIKER